MASAFRKREHQVSRRSVACGQRPGDTGTMFGVTPRFRLPRQRECRAADRRFVAKFRLFSLRLQRFFELDGSLLRFHGAVQNGSPATLWSSSKEGVEPWLKKIVVEIVVARLSAALLPWTNKNGVRLQVRAAPLAAAISRTIRSAPLRRAGREAKLAVAAAKAATAVKAVAAARAVAARAEAARAEAARAAANPNLRNTGELLGGARTCAAQTTDCVPVVEFLMPYDDREYHRRRSEIELEYALSATAPESAIAHLELARMHRARRHIIAQENLMAARRAYNGPILRTDKEA